MARDPKYIATLAKARAVQLDLSVFVVMSSLARGVCKGRGGRRFSETDAHVCLVRCVAPGEGLRCGGRHLWGGHGDRPRSTFPAQTALENWPWEESACAQVSPSTTPLFFFNNEILSSWRE